MLSKEKILEITCSGLNVFRHYIPGDWKVRRNFCNPLYNDINPSCNIFLDRKSGVYRMKDFGNDDYSGDCFYIVGKIKGYDCSIPKDFIEILRIINRDLFLGIEDEQGNKNHDFSHKLDVLPTKIANTEVRIEDSIEIESLPYYAHSKPFSASELDYWLSYGITKDTLKRFRVISLSYFESQSRQGRAYRIDSMVGEPIFGYEHPNFIKIYRPLSTMRFIYGGDLPENYCFGLEHLPSKGDVLYITGGEKDVLSLSARGFHAICFNSETAQIQPTLIRKLSFMFKHIVILYDVDKTGLSSSLKIQQQLSEFGVKRLLLPLPGTKQAKDISDYFRLGNSIDDFKFLFLDLLDTLYSNTISILKSCEVNFETPPPQAQMVVSVNDVPLGTQGNLLCITGGEGTGKSNFVGALISGSLNSLENTIDTLGITIESNVNNRVILLYDTEQSEVQLYKNSVNILRRSKLERMPETYKAYSLTGMARNVRLQSIVESMDRFYHYYGGIHIVIIDGIADLIRGANDESESIAIVEELYRLAGIYKTCIVCVLHFVPNGLKLRGHLGSELQRKAAAILSIERDEDPSISVVKALKVRDGSPLDVPMIQFAWNKDAAMHLYVGEKTKEYKEQRKENELLSVARDIFKRRSHLTYNDLCTELQTALDVKERTAKSYIRFMREKEIVITDPSNSSYLMIGVI